MPVCVVRMDLRHVPEVAALEKQCFSLPWTERMIREELSNPLAMYWAAEADGRLVGYAGLQLVVGEGYINNIAVDPACRRQGIAAQLLETLLVYAAERLASFVTLEVRVSNAAAIALYTRFGFASAGIRRGYYHKPTEDALLMTRAFESVCVDSLHTQRGGPDGPL